MTAVGRYAGERLEAMNDDITVSSSDGTKHLLAMKLCVEDRPLVYLAMMNAGGFASHKIYLSPLEAAHLANWLLQPWRPGWGIPVVAMGPPRAPTAQPGFQLSDPKGEKAALICYVLDVLAWKLPRSYGPAWIAGELAAAGISIEWNGQQECFRPKPIGGGK